MRSRGRSVNWWIESGEQWLAARLSDNRSLLGAVVVAAVYASVIVLVCAANAFCGYTTIGEGRKCSSLLVHRKIVKVEQVAGPGRAGCTVSTNHSALHRIIRRSVDSYPGAPAVVSGRDESVPGPGECHVRIPAVGAGCRRAKEKVCSAVAVAGCHSRENAILNTVLGPDVLDVVPGKTTVVRDRYSRVTIAVRVAKVDSAIRPDAH